MDCLEILVSLPFLYIFFAIQRFFHSCFAKILRVSAEVNGTLNHFPLSSRNSCENNRTGRIQDAESRSTKGVLLHRVCCQNIRPIKHRKCWGILGFEHLAHLHPADWELAWLTPINRKAILCIYLQATLCWRRESLFALRKAQLLITYSNRTEVNTRSTKRILAVPRRQKNGKNSMERKLILLFWSTPVKTILIQ